MSTDIPKQIGPFEVIRFLGAGGMGEVFLAQDPRLRRRVAIKRIRAAAGAEPERLARLHREAQLAAGLNHPTIVQVHDLLSVDGVDHIVMEYVPGPSLRRQLQQNGPLPSGEGLRVARALADGLAYAHRAGVVHRDLKTENVLLTPEGLPKISDFGIARRLESHASPRDEEQPLTRVGTLLGTYRAMSPEQVCGDPVDHRSDLFSFGVLLYELFTGRSPFLAESNRETREQVLNHHPPPLREVAPEHPPELSELIEHLLEKDPLLRPRDAEEVGERLRLMSDDPGSVLTGATIEPTAGAFPSRETYSSDFETLSDRRMKGIRWLLAISLAIAGSLGIAVVAPWKSAGGQEILYVAVLKSQAAGDQESEASDLLAFAVRNAMIRTLISLEGLSPKPIEVVDPIEGTPIQVARVLAVDEVLTSRFACEARLCQVEVSRMRAADERLLWSDQTSVPLNESLVAARAVDVLVRGAYPDLRTRPGVVEGKVEAPDYDTYLEIRRLFVDASEIVSYPDLLERLEAIRLSSPNFSEAYLLEARIALRRFSEEHDDSLLDHAFDLIAHAQVLEPKNPWVFFTRVDGEIIADRLDDATETLGELERLVPGHIQILEARARILSKQNKLREAFDVYQAAVERQPAAGLLLNYARVALQIGEIATARDAAQRHLDLLPKSLRGLRFLATIELTHGDASRAADLLEELIPQSSRTINFVLLGLSRMRLGAYREAAEAFEQAIEQVPNNPHYLLNLADARWLLGETREASALYRKILALTDEEASSQRYLTLRAQAFAHLGDERKAAAAIQEALQNSPGSKDVAFEAALVYTLTGNPSIAFVNAEQALQLGYHPQWFDLPWFDELRLDPEFARLLSQASAPR